MNRNNVLVPINSKNEIDFKSFFEAQKANMSDNPNVINKINNNLNINVSIDKIIPIENLMLLYKLYSKKKQLKKMKKNEKKNE